MLSGVLRRRDVLKNASIAVGAFLASPLKDDIAASARSDLIDLTASAAVDAMRKGEIKAEDYAQSLLDRAQRLSRLNAFRTLHAEDVLQAARAADARRSTGATLGLLHGLPVPVKDSVDTKVLPTSYGTRALETFTPRDNAWVVQRLLDAGGLVMGKTNLHELSFGWTSDNATFGAVHNPYDESRIPGGSSGGSAVAVAARMAPLAVAEDTWASIRLPAACCGLAGLRPTYGRYKDAGIMPLTTMFDQTGPLARCVEDLALFDGAMMGGTQPVTRRALSGARIGVPRAFFWDGAGVDVERLVSDALRKLREAGAVIVETPTPPIVSSTPEIAATIISFEARHSIAAFLQREGANISFETMLEKVGPNVKTLMTAMALPPNRPSAAVYQAALDKRAILQREIAAYFRAEGLDALMFPATLCPAPRIGAEDAVDIGGHSVSLADALARNMALGSCASMASLVLPVGLSSGGLPVGVEFAALPGSDRDLLGLGLSLERALGTVPPPAL